MDRGGSHLPLRVSLKSGVTCGSACPGAWQRCPASGQCQGQAFAPAIWLSAAKHRRPTEGSTNTSAIPNDGRLGRLEGKPRGCGDATRVLALVPQRFCRLINGR